MNQNMFKRALALVLAMVMVLGMGMPGAKAATETLSVQKLDKISAQLTQGQAIENQKQELYADTDMVRVMIVLEGNGAIGMLKPMEKFADSTAAQTQRAQLQARQEKLAETISAQALKGKKLDVVWNLTLMANAISANVAYGDIEAIAEVEGVEKVYLEKRYDPQSAQTNNIVAQEMTGADTAQNTYGYTGAGSRIAVVDTGTDSDHQSFSAEGYEYALALNAQKAGMSLDEYKASLNLLTVEGIEKVLSQLNVSKRVPGITAEELYFNSKMPFNFNYVDGDLNITHDFDEMGSHGSHVAGIAAANRYISVDKVCDLDGDGDMDKRDAQKLMDHVILGEACDNLYTADLNLDGVVDEQDVTVILDAIDSGYFADAAKLVGVTGVAPDAQLITMKVFGVTGGAYATDYMAATEDAVILGCDSVNLSLGGANPGFAGSHEYEAANSQYIDNLMKSLEETGIVMCVSAGNSGNWADNDMAYGMMYADEGGTYTTSEPATYANALGVASADNVGLVTDIKTTFNGLELRMEGVSGGFNEPWISLDPQSQGVTFDCVFIGDPTNLLTGREQTDLSIYGGNVEDYVDVAGKVVLVARGNGVSFADKHANGALAGAAAVIIYNNVYDPIYASIEGSTATIPCATISLAQAQTIYGLFNGNCGTFTVEHKLNVNHDTNEYEDHIAMSDFSSWGTTGDLALKPEITAPGGNIYSVNGVDPSGTAYEQMSGTSMSSPHVAGLVALASQYIDAEGLVKKTGLSQRALIQSLMMSTAEVLMENGLPYSVRNQGAGLASIENMILADSIVMVDGQPDGKVKAELGDGTEDRVFQFSITNLTDQEQTYDLSAQIMTTGVTTIDGHALATDEMVELDAYVFLGSEDNTVTVPALSSTDVTVVISISQETADEMKAKGFDNGFYIEGFVYAEPVADAEGKVGSSHSIPLLGWYGSWTDISMYEANEHLDFAYNTLERPAHMADFSTNILSWAPKGYGEGMYYSGNIYGSMNTETGEAIGDSRYIEARNAVNSEASIWELYAVFPTLIRNAADYKLTIYDSETGEVYYLNDYEHEDDYMLASFYYMNYGQWYNTTTESPVDLSQWEFTDLQGNPLPEDTKFTIELACAPDYYVREDGTVDWSQVGEGAYLRWNFNVDNTAPELVADSLKLEGNELHYTVQDNNYIAAVILLTGDASGAVNYTFPDMDEDQRGMAVSGTLDLTGFREYFGQKAAIAVCDYAGNESYYAINLGGEGASYGDLVAFRYDAGGYTGSWVSFSEGVERNETGLFPAGVDMVAAEYVNGLVFCQDNSGNLYGIEYADLLANSVDLEQTFITKLNNIYQDFAYNYSDGKLYALYTYEYEGYPTAEINTINLKGAYYDEDLWMEVAAYQEDPVAQRGGVYALSMAIDADGSIYILGPNYDWDTEEVAGTAHLWKAPAVVEWGMVNYVFTDLGDTGMGMDYLQSMTFNHNTGDLYWAQFYPRSFMSMETNLVKLNPETAEAEIVGELSYETAAMFAPLTAETAAKPEFANVPDFDSTVIPTPMLSMHNLTMGVGNTQSLSVIFDPWYSSDKRVVWSSSDESVATVDQNGNITAVSDGSCTITVSAAGDGTKFDACEVTVASLTLNIEGIVSRTEGGINSVWGSKLYDYDMKLGKAQFTEGALITAPEEFQGFGLNIGAAIEARGSIWACEFGNAGMIYKINKDSGEVEDLLYPIDGDMMFGFDYSEATDMFAGIMNYYFYADLTMDDAMYDAMKESYDESIYQYTYHKFDMSEYLRASDKGFNTGETNQGSIVDVVFCGITAVDNVKNQSYYVTSNFDGQGYCGESTYTPVTTHVILDNVGRLWYIDETQGLQYTSDEYGNSFYHDAQMTSMISGDNTGVFALQLADGTYNVFMIRQIVETPLSDMYLGGTMPRITYHFSDIYYAGESEEGAPMFFLSLYDYWHEGTTNELYLYVPGVEYGERYWDMDKMAYVQPKTPDSLYDLGDTGFGNIIATITGAEVVAGLPAVVIPEQSQPLAAPIFRAKQ